MKSVFSAWLQRFRTALSAGDATAASPEIPILLATSRDDDATSLREVLAHTRWTLVRAHAWTDAFRAQTEFGFPIVLYDRDLAGIPWHEGVPLMMRAGRPPAIILLSAVADPYLWDEVVQAGGFDLLPRPFRRDETLAMIAFAHTHWKTAWPNSRQTQATDANL